MKDYYVYILASKSGTLYVGMTNNIKRRVWEHKNKLVKGFTEKYNINILVHVEHFSKVQEAISCEKKIKGWVRKKKIELIESQNSGWKDLSAGWYES